MQDQLKKKVAQAAANYIRQYLPEGSVLGIGTGSTVNLFIDAMAVDKHRWYGAVSSSEATTVRLQAYNIPILSLNEIDVLPIYVDGADEITPNGWMIKGGGGALTREKIIASVAKEFVCIADINKYVDVLGKFPIPIEIIPMARTAVIKKIKEHFPQSQITLRCHRDGIPFMTDNCCEILDVDGLRLLDPMQVEHDIDLITGVVSVGIFARRAANMLLLGKVEEVQMIRFDPPNY